MRVSRHRHTLHAHGVAAHGAHFALAPHDGLAGARYHDNLLADCHPANANQLVALFQIDGDESVTACAVVEVHRGLLHHAMLSGEHEIFVLWEILRRNDGGNCLALLQRQQVHDCGAASVARCLGKLIHLQAIYLARSREEQHIGMRRGDKQVLDVVVVLQAHALHALAAALLLAIGGHGKALHVARLRHGDDHVFLGNQVLDVDILRVA